jgi:hypothetical protein
MDTDELWFELKPGVWRSLDGRYAIIRTVLPEDRPDPTEVYTLRKVSPEMAAAHPGGLGYFVSERYRLEEAKGEAARDAYCEAHAGEMSVPEDFPALALERFFWPISGGITKAALVVVRDGDRTVARVVGMARQEDPFVPVTYAEIDLGAILTESQRFQVAEARDRLSTWDLARGPGVISRESVLADQVRNLLEIIDAVAPAAGEEGDGG